MISSILSALFAVVGQLEQMYIFTDFPSFSLLKVIVSFAVTSMILGLFLGKHKIITFDPYTDAAGSFIVSDY